MKIKLEKNQKPIWTFIGVGAIALTALGVFLYYRSSRRTPENARVKMVEAMIREAEALIRQHR